MIYIMTTVRKESPIFEPYNITTVLIIETSFLKKEKQSVKHELHFGA